MEGPPVRGVRVNGVENIYFGGNPQELARAYRAKSIRSTVNVDVPAFVRMLAKIGYCFAVARRSGVDT